MSQDFLYFNKDNLVETFEIMKPKVFTTTVKKIPNFMVIFGKNGVGKSRLLKAIRQQIVNSQNSIFPELIVRKLDYGKEPDSYDPDSTNHPLVNPELIENFFECSFEKWKDMKNTKGSKEIDRVYKIYEDEIINDKELGKKPERCYFVEFKKYFRRQILKKICFGCLEQLLMLNVTYDNDIEKINKAFEDDSFKAKYDLEFNYKIIKNKHNIVEKLELNELIEFVSTKKPEIRIKFSDLSPGEKLILHLFVIWKDQVNIKIDKNEISTKQILLLDEPDSHCEPNLVLKLVKFLNEFLVETLMIQVIMTCHNTTTLFCFKYEESLFILNESNSKVMLEKKPDTDISNELASNINYQINFLKLDFRQIHAITKDYLKSLGASYEDLIKKMTKGEKDFNFSKRIEFIKLLTGVYNDIDEKIIKFNDKDEHKVLEKIEFNKEEYLTELNIFWPKNKNNEAWDFMIFYQNQLYLYQISTTDKDLKKQLKLSENVFNRLIGEPNFDIWIKSKFFLIKSTIDEDLNNENCSDQLDLDKILKKSEIFQNLFLSPKKKNNSEEKNSHAQNLEKDFTIDGSFLVDNFNNKFNFEKKINFFEKLDNDLYAINFKPIKVKNEIKNDFAIKILRFKDEKFELINSLFGHDNQPKKISYSKQDN